MRSVLTFERHGGELVQTGTGMFHKWGNEIIETSDGEIINYTVAIVEHPDGTVLTYIPTNIAFIGTEMETGRANETTPISS
jgi:hypothetical protein